MSDTIELRVLSFVFILSLIQMQMPRIYIFLLFYADYPAMPISHVI